MHTTRTRIAHPTAAPALTLSRAGTVARTPPA